MTDNWKPDERTVRACIEALPKEVWPAVAGFTTTPPVPVSTIACRLALEALLPTPNPLKGLVQQWMEDDRVHVIDDRPSAIAENFLHWAIMTGKLKP